MNDIDCVVCGKRHRPGLGGTAMARIFGLVPGTNALDVYHKLTRPPADEVPDEDATIDQKRGHWLEPMAADHYVVETGRKLEEPDNPVYHPDYPAFVCHLDRVILADKGRDKAKRKKGVLEIKNPRAAKYSKVIDYGLFQSESVQNMTYGAVARMPWGSIVWHNLEHSKGPIYYVDIVYQQKMLDFLLEAGQRFWDEHVVPRVPPDPTEWELLAREDAPKLEKVEGELLVLEDEHAEQLAAAFVEARDVRAEANELYERRSGEMLSWMHLKKLKRAEVPTVGRFTVVQSEGRQTFSEKSLALARPLDWDLVRAYLVEEGHAADTLDGQLSDMALDLTRFKKRGYPFEYVLPPRP